MLNVPFVIYHCENPFKRDVATDSVANVSRKLPEGTRCIEIEMIFFFCRIC